MLTIELTWTCGENCKPRPSVAVEIKHYTNQAILGLCGYKSQNLRLIIQIEGKTAMLSFKITQIH